MSFAPSSTLTFLARLVIEEVETTTVAFSADLISLVAQSARDSNSSFHHAATSVAFFAANLEHNWGHHNIVWIAPVWHRDQTINSPLSTFVSIEALVVISPLVSSLISPLVSALVKSLTLIASPLISALIWIGRNIISPLSSLVWIRGNIISPLSSLIGVRRNIISPLTSLIRIWRNIITPLTTILVSPLATTLIWIRNNFFPLISSLIETLSLSLIRVSTPLITSIKSLVLVWLIKSLVATSIVIPHPDILLIQDTNCTLYPNSKHKNLSANICVKVIFFIRSYNRLIEKVFFLSIPLFGIDYSQI